MNEKMREEFEAWALARFINSQTMKPLQRSADEAEGYHYPVLNTAWAAWQASRQALVIELPDDGIDDCQEAWGDRCKNTFDCGYNFASLRHEQAIEAAGLKVKP